MTHIKEFFKHNHAGHVTKHVVQHLDGEWLTETTIEAKYLNDTVQIIQKQTTIEEFNLADKDEDEIKTWIDGSIPFKFED